MELLILIPPNAEIRTCFREAKYAAIAHSARTQPPPTPFNPRQPFPTLLLPPMFLALSLHLCILLVPMPILLLLMLILPLLIPISLLLHTFKTGAGRVPLCGLNTTSPLWAQPCETDDPKSDLPICRYDI